MTIEAKLKGIAKYLDEFVKDTKDINKDFFTKEEIEQFKGGLRLALEILIKFHLEEHLD